MSTEQNIPVSPENLEIEVSNMAEMAAKMEEEARNESNAQIDVYTHYFRKPFTYMGKTYEKLTFDWDSLTGKDELDLQKELRLRGITVTADAFTEEYVEGVVFRACTERDENGGRVLCLDMLKAMKFNEKRKIFSKARRFLLRAGV